jgi:chaperone modulatory protein CbpM
VLEPEGTSAYTWRFDTHALKRLQIAIRLEQDLGVNLPGSALELDLLEEMERLKR